MQVLMPLLHVALLVLLLKEDELLYLTGVRAILGCSSTCVEEVDRHQLVLFRLDLLDKLLLSACLAYSLDFEVFKMDQLFVRLRGQSQYLWRLLTRLPPIDSLLIVVFKLFLTFQDDHGILILD